MQRGGDHSPPLDDAREAHQCSATPTVRLFERGRCLSDSGSAQSRDDAIVAAKEPVERLTSDEDLSVSLEREARSSGVGRDHPSPAEARVELTVRQEPKDSASTVGVSGDED